MFFFFPSNIRKLTINFSKKLAKNTNKRIAVLEAKLKHFKKHENYVNNIDYKVCKPTTRQNMQNFENDCTI